MAAIAKSGSPTVSTASPSFEHQQAGKVAGEAIAAGDALTINSDGTLGLWSTGDKYRGIAASDASIGEPVTVWSGVNFHYGAGLTPGAEVYLSSTVPGGLDDTGTIAVGYVVDGSRIHFYNVFPQP